MNTLMGTGSVTIGRLIKPFGVKGEVRVESLIDIPGCFEKLPHVSLVSPGGTTVKTEIIKARPSGRFYLLRFSAFSTPEEAAKFRDALIQIPQEVLPPSAAERFYEFELIGLSVRDELGQDLGTVEEIMDLPQHSVFVARQEKIEHLIPGTRLVVKHIDVENRLITVAPIEQWGISHAV